MKIFTDQDLIERYNKNENFQSLYDMKCIDLNTKDGTIQFEFNIDKKFCNPTGDVQGGLLSGMIDDTMALSFIFKTHFTKRPPTIEIKTNFLYPTKAGKAYGFGRVVKAGKNLVFLEGHLKQDNKIVVTATSTAVIVDMPTSRTSILSTT
ncbi:PaaI family thioesterase [Pelagibacterales bacterium]|nr:PaaI family thioesterase [Pelagibacterales bacterium]